MKIHPVQTTLAFQVWMVRIDRSEVVSFACDSNVAPCATKELAEEVGAFLQTDPDLDKRLYLNEHKIELVLTVSTEVCRSMDEVYEYLEKTTGWQCRI